MLTKIQLKRMKHPRKRPRNIQENVQEMILLAIKDNPFITRKELENLLGRSHGVVKYNISQLIQKKIIKHEGATKAGRWVVVS